MAVCAAALCIGFAHPYTLGSFSKGVFMPVANRQLVDLLGASADGLLNYTAKGFKRETLHLPGSDFVDRVISISDRSPTVLRNFNSILNHGRLAGTGYVSIFPV